MATVTPSINPRIANPPNHSATTPSVTQAPSQWTPPTARDKGGQDSQLHGAPQGGLADEQAGERGVGIEVVVRHHPDGLQLLVAQQVGFDLGEDPAPDINGAGIFLDDARLSADALAGDLSEAQQQLALINGLPSHRRKDNDQP